MDDWQRRVIARIVDEIDEFEAGHRGLDRLIVNIDGLFQAAEIKEGELQEEFFRLWLAIETERELRTEEFVKLGSTPDDDVLADALSDLREWVLEAIAPPNA